MILADALEAATAALAKHSIDAMYRSDSFWLARFGERGRTFALEDGARHVQYLVTALRERSSRPIEEYARWAQGILTTRGMCTRHLAENFDRLAQAMDALGVEGREEAAPYLVAARNALVYATAPAADLLAAEAEVVRGALAPDASADEARATSTLWSYVVDAVALGSPVSLASHAWWLAARDAHATERLEALVRSTEAVSSTLGAVVAGVAGPALATLRRS
jgi:hypothetical protein